MSSVSREIGDGIRLGMDEFSAPVRALFSPLPGTGGYRGRCGLGLVLTDVIRLNGLNACLIRRQTPYYVELLACFILFELFIIYSHTLIILSLPQRAGIL